MFVGEINYKHFADSRTGSSGAYKGTLVAGMEELNFNIIIKVSSCRLYNVYNQQEVLKPKIAGL